MRQHTPQQRADRPFVIKPHHEAILRALHRYYYLNRDHVRRLFYSDKATNYPREVLQELVGNHYCLIAPFYKRGQGGRPEHMYTLDNAGYNYLRPFGFEKRRLRKHKLPTNFHHWDHLVTLNHALISGELLARQHPQIALHQMLHDFDFDRMKIAVPLAEGAQGIVEPDGLQEFRVREAGKRYQDALLCECDRGTNGRFADWEAKCVRLLSFMAGALPERFGIRAVKVAIFAPDEKRAAVLASWTRTVIERVQPPEDLFHFFFTSANPATTPARDFFLAPHWQHVFGDGKTPIMEVHGE